MTLPIVPLPRATVKVGDQDVEVRGLSRSEAMKLGTEYGPEKADEAEVFLLCRGAGVTEDEARAWRDQVDTDTAGIVIDKIIELSALTS